MNKLYTLLVLLIYFILPINNSSADWITKKSNKKEKVAEINQMYKDGYLNKMECVAAKEKILNTKDYKKTNCDNVKVKQFITKKEKEKFITKKERNRLQNLKKRSILKLGERKFLIL